MALYYKIIFALFFHSIFSNAISKPHKKSKNAVTIKKNRKNNIDACMIASCDTNKSADWLIQANNGFVLDDGKQHANIEAQHIELTVKNGFMYLNGKKLAKSRIIIKPYDQNIFLFEKQQLSGFLMIERQKERWIITQGNVQQAEEKSTMQDLSNEIDVNASKIDDDPHNKSTIKSTAQSYISEAYKDKQFTVRVLLNESSLPLNSWNFKCDYGFILSAISASKNIHYPSKEISVKIKSDGSIFINGQKMFDKQIFIQPRRDSIVFDTKSYQGAMWILADQEKTMLINCVGIEDYVASVLRTESWPGWPLEVNKVFAVASRTYVISMVQQANTQKRPYHVKNTNAHQTYTGGIISGVLKEAVLQTQGLFLTYKKQPITAMFDACCGGIIPAKMLGVNFNDAPYLARKYPCEYCKLCKIYSWQIEYDLYDLEKLLKKELQTLRRLKDIKISKKDNAGLVHELSIKGAGHQLKIGGKKAYSLLNKGIKSFCYSVSKSSSSDKIIFKGRGYGHHLGLCQWGAKEMVGDGWGYQEVLSFYYPGTQLMRLL
jgi:stage II sporulation protein D